MNHRIPSGAKTAVLRLTLGVPAGRGKRRTADVAGSTRTMALSPLSVTHGAPSGPTITPWGDDPAPRSTWVVAPVAGSSRPSSPEPWAVYQTEPSAAGATSWGRDPAGTG